MKINNRQSKVKAIQVEWLNPAGQYLSLTIMVNLTVEKGKFSAIVKRNETKEETSPADGCFMEINGIWQVV